MSEVRTLATATTGRYLVESAGPSLLVGFHGYGQNAETLLEYLRSIPGAGAWTLASVQALHRFYNAKTQEVVGSWMTRLDRDQAIADNLAYVEKVVADLRAAGAGGGLVFAGFSQGAAMAWRAAARIPCQGLLVLGGDLPPDVAQAPGLALPPLLIGRGRQDAFYTAEQLEQDLGALATRGFRPEALTFEGGHEWGPAFCEGAGRFLERVR